MWGRWRRAARAVSRDAAVDVYAVMNTFDPERAMGVLAVGVGTAGGLGGGGGATGPMVASMLAWGRRSRGRYVRLPHRVFVTVGPDGGRVHTWPVTRGAPASLVLPTGGYEAEPENAPLLAGVRLTLPDGKWLVISGPRGVVRRRASRIVRALVAHARPAATA